MTDTLEGVKKHIKFYIIIGAALMVLTVVTVLISGVDFGHPTTNIVIALIVATLKAGMVAAIFMHLFWDMFVHLAIIFKVLIVTAVFFFGLFALTLWSMRDEVKSPKELAPTGVRTREQVQETHVP
jgi:cytochrome c oxidase subunit 4